MAYTVTIDVKIPVIDTATVADKVAPTLAPEFVLSESYVDNSNFRSLCGDPSIYPENHFDKENFAMVSSVKEFMDKVSNHPSILSAFKEAYSIAEKAETTSDSKTGQKIKSGKYEFVVEDYKEALYIKEAGSEIADEGFTVTVVEKTA